MDKPGYLLVLTGEGASGVKDEEHDVGFGNGFFRLDDGGFGPLVGELLQLADSRGVHDQKGLFVEDDQLVKNVSCCVWFGADDSPLLPRKSVQERRFTDICLPDYGHLQGMVVVLSYVRCGNLFNNSVQKLIEPFAVLGRDGKSLLVERVLLRQERVDLLGRDILGLVHDDENRDANLFQEPIKLSLQGKNLPAAV
ncbi:MAG: hypothetical protein BWY86_00868 [Candidatus Aminicenantes bacterium ADurb.Bin508]|nr:MAG: hypothetical protein BWY86_00868 [Candidatus Aminicenantes bacterium ADurb.Bin508]